MCGCGCGLALILADMWMARGDPTKAGSPRTEDSAAQSGGPEAGWPSGSFGGGPIDQAGVALPRWLLPGPVVASLFAWPRFLELAKRVHSRWRSLP